MNMEAMNVIGFQMKVDSILKIPVRLKFGSEMTGLIFSVSKDPTSVSAKLKA